MNPSSVVRIPRTAAQPLKSSAQKRRGFVKLTSSLGARDDCMIAIAVSRIVAFQPWGGGSILRVAGLREGVMVRETPEVVERLVTGC